MKYFFKKEVPAGLLYMVKLILKFICNCKEPRIAKTILKKRNKVGRAILPNFKMPYGATISKIVAVLA